MARILQKFIAEGRQLHEPETVQVNLLQGIRTKNEQVLFSYEFDLKKSVKLSARTIVKNILI